MNGDINFLPINNNKLNIYSQYVIGQLVNQGVDIFYIDVTKLILTWRFFLLNRKIKE